MQNIWKSLRFIKASLFGLGLPVSGKRVFKNVLKIQFVTAAVVISQIFSPLSVAGHGLYSEHEQHNSLPSEQSSDDEEYALDLNPDEYNHGPTNSIVPIGLIGLWKFDENTGTTVLDNSPSGLNGTLTNGASWTPGKVGTGILLDGINDTVEIGNHAPYNFGTNNFS